MSTLGLQSIVFIVGGWGMFRTHLQAEVKGAVAFGYGLRVWRYVEQAIQWKCTAAAESTKCKQPARS